MKRHIILVLGLSAIPLVSGLCLWFFVKQKPSLQPGVTVDNFYLLRSGMSQKEINAIFGQKPWGRMRIGTMTLQLEGIDEPDEREGTWLIKWKEKDRIVSIFFNDGSAYKGYFEANDGTAIQIGDKPPTFIDQVRGLVGF